MSAFWHWFVVILTLGFIAATVWLLVATRRTRVPSTKNEEGQDTTGHVWDEDITELNKPLPRWWLWLFYGTIVWSLVYLLLYPGLGRFPGLLNWSQEGQYQSEKARAAADFEERFADLLQLPLEAMATHPDALHMGRNIFAHNCSGCHGSDARGAPGFPDLTDQNWSWGGEPEQVFTSIYLGRRGVMPPFGGLLDDQSVTRTTFYVQQLAGQRVNSAMAAAGRRQFEQFCAACHGSDATGNPQHGAPDLTTGRYTYGGRFEDIRHTIRDGRIGIMPAHKDLLDEGRSRLVAAYVLSLGREDDE